MRATCFGARSGRISMTTLPLVVSSTSVSSGLAMTLSFQKIGRRLFRVGGDLHLDHAVGIGDRAVVGGRALLDLVDHVHAGDDLADHGVLAVEARVLTEHDEELA